MTEMIEGFFLGFKFLIPGFLGVGKFGKYLFGGWLDLSIDFLGYSIPWLRSSVIKAHSKECSWVSLVLLSEYQMKKRFQII